jgi:membrane-associated phospholipid phosphatase
MLRMSRVLAAWLIALAFASGAAAQTATPEPAPDSAPPPASSEPAERDPFIRLIPNLVTDLGRLVSTRDNAITWGIGGAAALALRPFDHDVSDDLLEPSSGGVMHAATVFGGGYIQAGGAVAAYAIGRLTHHKPTAHIGADLVRAHALTGLLTHGVKRIVRRDRPQASDSSSSTFSFPSAHASATWTNAAVLWRHLGWKVGVPAAAVATLVSASRVEQRQHFMSDVAFGAAIGIASARTVTMGHGSGHQVTIAPVPLRNGIAVMATVGR